MPIAINGSGTVTGISVGGLPDGIVDADMLANSAAAPLKRGSGSTLQTVITQKSAVTREWYWYYYSCSYWFRNINYSFKSWL